MDESDVYVRDHLLIEFMIHNYAPISFSEHGKKFIEDIYREWRNYLKYLEVEHAKRSKV